MAKCSRCSAPLAANTNQCAYCGTRNDVDLKDTHNYVVVNEETSLLCPHCEDTLQAIDLESGAAFIVQRCKSCFGLFFDPGKVELLLEKSAGPVSGINWRLLDNINLERFQEDKKVKYVKCPVCRSFMSRQVFGYRSGVVVDRCTAHGVWLDSGEITHLMEWKKAGGQLLQKQQQTFEAGEKVRQQSVSHESNNKTDYPCEYFENELLGSVVNIIEKLFQ